MSSKKDVSASGRKFFLKFFFLDKTVFFQEVLKKKKRISFRRRCVKKNVFLKDRILKASFFFKDVLKKKFFFFF